MTDNNNSLQKNVKMPAFGIKKGIMANAHAHEQKMKNIDPLKVPNRLGLVIDDSGSMGQTGMDDAHAAVTGFTLSCNFEDTSIAIYPLNAGAKSLICEYDIVRMYANGLGPTGGTPIYTKLRELIETESITRAILFSDGEPTDGRLLKTANDYQPYYADAAYQDRAPKVIAQYIEKEIPIDTIYIGVESAPGYKEMQEIAKQTNGNFLHFTNSSVLGKSLKYLAPKFRGLLANPEIKEKIERGESV